MYIENTYFYVIERCKLTKGIPFIFIFVFRFIKDGAGKTFANWISNLVLLYIMLYTHIYTSYRYIKSIDANEFSNFSLQQFILTKDNNLSNKLKAIGRTYRTQ